MRGRGKNVNSQLAESELIYHSIFSNSFDGILLTAPDGKILAANPAACRMFGRSEEEMCKLGRAGVMNINDPRLETALEQRELMGEFAGELTGVRSDGTIFPVEITTSVFTNSSGEQRASMIIRDISFRKRLRHELEVREAHIRSVIENTDNCIWSVDNNFRFLDGNSAFQDRFQRRTCRRIQPGDDIIEWMPAEMREQWKRYLTRGLSGVSFTTMSSAGARHDRKYLRYSFNPIRNLIGEITGVTVMGTDISDLMIMQKGLVRTGVMLKEAQSVAKLGNWEYDARLNKADWSDELLRIFGLPSTTGETSWDIHLGRIHPDDLIPFEAAVMKAYSEGIPFSQVFRIQIPGEEIKWIRVICKVEKDRHGSLTRLYGTAQDVSEHEISERKLRTTEMLLRSVLSNAPLTIFATDRNGVFTLSEGMELIQVGLKPGENVGVSAYDLYNSLPFADLSGTVIPGKEVLDRVLQGEMMVLISELRGVFFENHLGPITDEKNNVTGMVGVAINITHQKIAEIDLSRSEERYRNLFENSVVPILEEDFSEVKRYFDKLKRKGVKDFRKYFRKYPERAAQCVPMVRIKDVNRTSLQFFGVREKTDLKRGLDVFFTDGSYKIFEEEIIALAEGKTEYECDIPVKMSGGEERFVHLRLHVVPDERDTLSQVLVSWIDITDRVNYEEGLKKSGETLRRLNMHIEEAREKERTEIAMNLHDDLGQKLTALKMNLSWLRKRIGVQSTLVSDKLDEVDQIIKTSIGTVQKISSDLRPAILYELGLKDAVEWHIKQNLEPAGIKGSFRLEPEDLEIDKRSSIVLFRIIQEALTNIIRHSGARRADIRISRFLSFAELVIKDNGKGIESDAVNDPKSFGLTGIKERVRNSSGQFRITGEKGKGTMLIVRIPLHKMQHTDDQGNNNR